MRNMLLAMRFFLGCLKNRLGDGSIGAAAADVAAQPLGDLRARGLGIFNQQRLGRHDLARRAVTALRADIADERLLQRFEFAVLSDTFDGQYGFFIGFKGQQIARAHRAIVDQYRAGAANFGLTGAFRAGEMEAIAEKLKQSFFDGHFAAPRFVVHRNC